jgi:hypothetical protein
MWKLIVVVYMRIALFENQTSLSLFDNLTISHQLKKKNKKNKNKIYIYIYENWSGSHNIEREPELVDSYKTKWEPQHG